MKKKKTRILFGTNDIGFRIGLYSNFLKEKFGEDILVHSYVTYQLPAEHYSTTYTYEYGTLFSKPALIRWFITFRLFVVFFFRYRTFFFFSGETLLTRKLRPLEFRLYKLFGKKLIMSFVGADIRSPKYLQYKSQNIYHFHNSKHPDITEIFQKKLIHDTVKYADQIFVSTPDLLDIVPMGTYFPLMLDVQHFGRDLQKATPLVKKPDEIWILHAPSGSINKGSAHIHKTLREKCTDKRIKFIFPAEQDENRSSGYSLSRYELLRLYLSCDIVIDQMVIGWYGLQTIEALYAGCAVVCYIDPRYSSYLAPECPVFLSDISRLSDCVSEIIQGPYLNNQEFKTKCRNWVLKNHTLSDETVGNKFDLLHP